MILITVTLTFTLVPLVLLGLLSRASYARTLSPYQQRLEDEAQMRSLAARPEGERLVAPTPGARDEVG